MTMLVPPPGQILSWLGGPIDIRIFVDTGVEEEVGVWDAALWDVHEWDQIDPVWQDATAYVFDVTIRAGTQRWGERFESASAVILVDNTEGFFTPESGVAHWDLPFQPGRKLQVAAIPDATTGETFALFTGQIDSTQDHYDDAGHALTTSIVCSDFLSRWAASNPLAGTPTGVQSTGARVHAALDVVDWPSYKRVIAAGVHTMQSSDLAQTTLEECGRAADAEGSAFYCDRNGNAVFKHRDWLTSDPRSVSIQGWLGYVELPVDPTGGVWDVDLWDEGIWQGFDTNTAHIVAIDTSWEAARIVNHAAFARSGSTLQVASDPTSISVHGLRSYHRTDLQNSDDAQVAILAERHVAAFKDSRMRVDAVTITAVEDPYSEDRNRLMWDTRFGDRLGLRIAPATGWEFEKEVHVMALSHHITADDWQVTFQLDDAQTYEGA